jgi:hypothetical protein
MLAVAVCALLAAFATAESVDGLHLREFGAGLAEPAGDGGETVDAAGGGATEVRLHVVHLSGDDVAGQAQRCAGVAGAGVLGAAEGDVAVVGVVQPAAEVAVVVEPDDVDRAAAGCLDRAAGRPDPSDADDLPDPVQADTEKFLAAFLDLEPFAASADQGVFGGDVDDGFEGVVESVGRGAGGGGDGVSDERDPGVERADTRLGGVEPQVEVGKGVGGGGRGGRVDAGGGGDGDVVGVADRGPAAGEHGLVECVEVEVAQDW